MKDGLTVRIFTVTDTSQPASPSSVTSAETLGRRLSWIETPQPDGTRLCEIVIDAVLVLSFLGSEVTLDLSQIEFSVGRSSEFVS